MKHSLDEETNSQSDAFVDNLLQTCFVTEANFRGQLNEDQELVFQSKQPKQASPTQDIGNQAVLRSLKALKTLK